VKNVVFINLKICVNQNTTINSCQEYQLFNGK